MARVRSPESGDFEGLVVQVDGPNVVIEFPRSAAPTLPLAHLFDVAFVGAGLDQTVRLPATVVRRDEATLSRSYALALESDTGAELHAAFLGRRLPRLQPDEPLEAHICGLNDEEPFRARVHDISGAGLSVVIDTADEQALCRLGAVRLRFVLPGDDAPLHFTGMIRHRRFEAGEIRYGIEFYRDRSADFDANILRVGHWVDARISSTDDPR